PKAGQSGSTRLEEGVGPTLPTDSGLRSVAREHTRGIGQGQHLTADALHQHRETATRQVRTADRILEEDIPREAEPMAYERHVTGSVPGDVTHLEGEAA